MFAASSRVSRDQIRCGSFASRSSAVMSPAGFSKPSRSAPAPRDSDASIGHVMATTNAYAAAVTGEAAKPGAPATAPSLSALASPPFDSVAPGGGGGGAATAPAAAGSLGVGAAPVQPATTRHAAART